MSLGDSYVTLSRLHRLMSMLGDMCWSESTHVAADLKPYVDLRRFMSMATDIGGERHMSPATYVTRVATYPLYDTRRANYIIVVDIRRLFFAYTPVADRDTHMSPKRNRSKTD